MKSPLEAPEKSRDRGTEATSAKIEKPAAAVIDTSKMAKGQREALELAEAARDPLEDRGSFAEQPFCRPLRFQSDLSVSCTERRRSRGRRRIFAEAGELSARTCRSGRDRSHRRDSPEYFKGLAEWVRLESRCRRNMAASVCRSRTTDRPQSCLAVGMESSQRCFPRISPSGCRNRSFCSARRAETQISAARRGRRNLSVRTHRNRRRLRPGDDEPRAEPTADGSTFVLNGEKLWCTNGVKAGVIVVMARTPSKMVGRKERNQITAFIVDVETPGVEVMHRCRFMGLRALYNGVVRFTDVQVPSENIISKEGAGLRVALTTLNTGRLTLPAACVGLSKRLPGNLAQMGKRTDPMGRAYWQTRRDCRQDRANGRNVFAMESMTFLTPPLLDRKAGDLRLEAAMCKMWATETPGELPMTRCRSAAVAATKPPSRWLDAASRRCQSSDFCATAASTPSSKARAKSCGCSSRAKRLIRT